MTTPANGMTKTLATLVRAKYPLIAVLSKEELRVERAIQAVANSLDPPFDVRTWSCTEGIRRVAGPVVSEDYDIAAALHTIDSTPTRALYILRDVHPYLEDPVVRRRLRDLARRLKGTPPEAARTVILLSPTMTLPADLQAEIHVEEWPLPSRPELERVLMDTITSVKAGDVRRALDALSEADRDRIASAALGLTAEEAQNAFSRSLIERRSLDPTLILQEKKQIVARSGVLEWMDPLPGGLESVGGLENLKCWLIERREAFSPEARAYGLPVPKGVFLAGVQGCGKTLTAKAVADAWQLPLLRLNVGALFGSLVGESESRFRQAVQTVKTIAPCVLLMDEIDKALGGSGGELDGGTSSRVRGEILTFLQERGSAEVFIVAAANNVELLAMQSPELLRKGRWDELFFVDLPHPTEREAIFGVHLVRRGIAGTEKRSRLLDVPRLAAQTEDFSGAEIEAVVVDAMFRAFADGRRPVLVEDLVAEAQRTVPLAKTAQERIRALREWGKVHARSASVEPRALPVGRQLEV